MSEDTTIPGAAQNTTATATANAPEPAATAAPDKSAPVSAPAADPIDSLLAKVATEADKAGDPAAGGILTGPPEENAEAGKQGAEDGKKPETADPYKPFTLPDGFVEDGEAMGRLKDIAGRHKLT